MKQTTCRKCRGPDRHKAFVAEQFFTLKNPFAYVGTPAEHFTVPRPVALLRLTREQRKKLQRWAARSKSAPHLARRARLILRCAEGLGDAAVARHERTSRITVGLWRSRFLASGLAGLSDEPRPGRPLRPKKKLPPRPPLSSAPRLPPTKPGNPVPILPPTDASCPPTLRTLARLAGVGLTTMSLALRGHPRISAARRTALQTLAREQGYRPDPEVGKLMAHLRRQRIRKLQGSICAVTSSAWQPPASAYCEQVTKGGRQRATELGFAWDTVALEELMARPKRIAHVLRNRGVECILLPPLIRNCALPLDAEWHAFSVVSATYSVLAPDFRRVVPFHHQNMWIICQHLRALGYQRIGLAMRAGIDLRVHHNYSTAFLGFHLAHRLAAPTPLLIGTYSRDELRVWFAREHPDAIVVASESDAEIFSADLGLTIPGPVAVVCTSRPATSRWAGVNELPELVGAAAVDLLGGMSLQREHGLPRHPTVMMIEGLWCDASSASVVG